MHPFFTLDIIKIEASFLKNFYDIIIDRGENISNLKN